MKQRTMQDEVMEAMLDMDLGDGDSDETPIDHDSDHDYDEGFNDFDPDAAQTDEEDDEAAAWLRQR